ncbi:MAG TPA: winged helix-turn-helix domain-containing protein [Pyrinomonadaceae bacterium]
MPDLGHQFLEFQGYRLDLVNRMLLDPQGEEVAMKPKVFDTLHVLVANQGRVVSKDDLLKEVWPDATVEENNLSQNISALRRIFSEKPGDKRFIETVAGRGFRFIPSVQLVDAEDPPEIHPSRLEADQPNTSQIPDPGSKRSIRNLAYAIAFVALLALGIGWLVADRGRPESLRSIAVLPFKPLVAENRNPALELGMTDTLIWKLSGGEVEVKPLSSVRRYDSLDVDPADAGRQLGVDAVLDGNLNVMDGRVRVSARLVRVADGKQIWASLFDDDFNGIFAVQDSISARVADELRISLGGNDKKRYTANAEAYRLFLQGRFLSQMVQESDIRNSITHFERALALDPSYVPAYVGLADANRALVLAADAEPSAALAKAKQAANKAVSLDASYAEAHAVRAWIMFWYDWDWDEAEKEVRLALSLDPNSSDSRQFYAHILSNTGRHNEALDEIRKAIEIEPLSLRANTFYGMFLYQARRYDEAMAQFQRVFNLDPNYRLALMFASKTMVQQGKFNEATATAGKAREQSPNATDPITFEACALASAGRESEARRILERLLSESGRRYISPYNIAIIYAAVGENQKALEYLEKAYAEKDVRMVFLGVEPKWDPLRSHARFIKLENAMNLKRN